MYMYEHNNGRTRRTDQTDHIPIAHDLQQTREDKQYILLICMIRMI